MVKRPEFRAKVRGKSPGLKAPTGRTDREMRVSARKRGDGIVTRAPGGYLGRFSLWNQA